MERALSKSGAKYAELVINPKDFPRVEIGDVVEIYHEEENFSRLLLQVNMFDESLQQNTVSVLDSIATAFCLKRFHEVNVRVVRPKDVALDLVEVVFKEQYLSRSDMWRLAKSILNSVAYVNKVARFADIRVTVDELWSRGDRVASGYITSDTKVTFRSATAQVNIFIQLSCEMWQFDNYGDLYFEKTMQGYLVDLFSRWKEKNCSHDVTITMFSRTFYEAKSLDEFPAYMRECVREDYKGRFYEDFYRVVVQNERYDDWTKTIIELKTHFNEYTDTVLNYHQRPGVHIPHAYNSTAAEGNFLEVLNMGLNIYEKFYLDRNFDRTGKLSLVITPGAGVFDVDRELTFITKQRTIDCGNSCDLVCMGEQPLHVVPLLKFHNTNPILSMDVGDDYNIPHWINHSFYMSENQEAHMKKNKFLPRIRAPVVVHDHQPDTSLNSVTGFTSPYLESEDVPFVDYDAYDAEVYNYSYSSQTRKSGMQRSQSSGTTEKPWTKWRKQRLMYTPCMLKELMSMGHTPTSIDVPADYLSSSYGTVERERNEDAMLMRKVVGSCGSPSNHHTKHSLHNYRPNRALINPFAPSRLHFKVTSNRRRWAHAFPTDTQGAAVQQHHQHSISSGTSDPKSDRPSPPLKHTHLMRTATEMRRSRSSKHSESDLEDAGHPVRVKNVSVTVSTSSDSGGEGTGRESQVTFKPQQLHSSSQSSVQQSESGDYTWLMSTSSRMRGGTSVLYSRSNSMHKDLSDFGWEDDHNWLFGVTGEQEWTPEVQTGMDWKSMMRPASLPITTDYFPDRRTMDDSYLVNHYTIIPEQGRGISDMEPERRRQLTTREVYDELIYQRLAQGFQIVLQEKPISLPSHPSSNMSPSPYQGSLLMKHRAGVEPQEVVLSIGRIFHHVKLEVEEITVKSIVPKHPYPQKTYHYTYRFQVPDSQAYDVSCTEFRNEKLEQFRWNYVDQYISTRGEDDSFMLDERVKFWRARFFLLPTICQATKKIIDGAPRCDLYGERKPGEDKQLTDGFVRFMEAINKIRRPHSRLAPRTNELPKRRVSLPVSPQAGSFARAERGRYGIDPHDTMHLLVGSPTLGLVHRESHSPAPPVALETKPKFEKDVSHVDIVEAMLDTFDGLHFLNDKEEKLSLPHNCFVAREAVYWLLGRINGIEYEDAFQIMKALASENYVCHASGKKRVCFHDGFVLYAIAYDKDKKETVTVPYNSAFENEWCEVLTHKEPADWASQQPVFVLPQLPIPKPTNQSTVYKNTHTYSTSCPASQYPKTTDPLMIVKLNTLQRESGEVRNAYVDVDAANRSDRLEWGTAKVHAHYQPRAAFQMELQWLVATGCILGELVTGWARKAGQNGFHFLPVPGDPFALPFTPNSDPLRGPIFVPLNIECLKDSHEAELFEDFPADTKYERLLLLQHAILEKFGFMPDKFKPGQYYPSLHDPAPPTYIHCSGGMFAMIPDGLSQRKNSFDLLPTQSKSRTGSDTKTKTAAEILQPRARKTSDQMWNNPFGENNISSLDLSAKYYRVGFLWAWNFMLTKKWRSNHTGDEHYQDKMLADFRAFCNNTDNRLREYWEESRVRFTQEESSHEFSSVLEEAGLDTVSKDFEIARDRAEGFENH